MPFRFPANCFFKSIPQRILALLLYIKPQPPLTRNQCQAYLNAFVYIFFKNKKSNKNILKVYNKTYYIKANTFSPYNWCIRSKSGSYIKVSFSILRQCLLQAFKLFNSLGLSSGVSLIFSAIITPGPFLALISST